MTQRIDQQEEAVAAFVGLGASWQFRLHFRGGLKSGRRFGARPWAFPDVKTGKTAAKFQIMGSSQHQGPRNTKNFFILCERLQICANQLLVNEMAIRNPSGWTGG